MNSKIQLVLFVCCFLISLATILSLECREIFKFGDYTFPKDNMTCNNTEEQCVIASYDIPQVQGIMFSRCRLCEPEEICNILESGPQEGVTNCQVTCCNTDYCNDIGAQNNGNSGASKDEGKKLIKNKKIAEKRRKHHKD
ncbi:uncharacterized protein LOC110244807 [Exaiptasia diaphana]|uniref:Uncharacterized protein n=1 Tax=Exaiptasia diaphana TaxID=2652724 RepID=A0A913XMF0_EXADI|nr:uncharacterized protein LOC110244807 [Exaiptasia diaphana]